MRCLRCQGCRHGTLCFSPQNQMPLGFIEPHLSVLSGLRQNKVVGVCGVRARETSFSQTTSSFLTHGPCDFRLVPEVSKPQPVLGTACLPLSAPNRLESWLRAASWSSRPCSLALRLRCDPGAKATFLRALLRREAIRSLMGLEHRCIPLAITITG